MNPVFLQRIERDEPPEAWEVTDFGTSYLPIWGVDLQLERSGKVGPYAVRFEPTAHDVALLAQLQPVEGGARHTVWARLMADDITSANSFTVSALWYDANKELLAFEGVSVDALLAVDEWEVVGKVITAPSGARFGRVILVKNAGNEFTGWLDEAALDRTTPCFEAERTSAQSVASGTTPTAVIVWDYVAIEDGVDIDDTTGVVTVRRPGAWVIEACATLDDLAGQSKAWLEIWWHRGEGGGYLKRLGDISHVGGPGARDARVSVRATIDLHTRDYFEVRVVHNHGSSRNLLGSIDTSQTFLRGTYMGAL